jgi:hypothetical protein
MLTLNRGGRQEILGNLGRVQLGEFLDVSVGPDGLFILLVARVGISMRRVRLDDLVDGKECLEHALDLVRGGLEELEAKVRSTRPDESLVEHLLLVAVKAGQIDVDQYIEERSE